MQSNKLCQQMLNMWTLHQHNQTGHVAPSAVYLEDFDVAKLLARDDAGTRQGCEGSAVGDLHNNAVTVSAGITYITSTDDVLIVVTSIPAGALHVPRTQDSARYACAVNAHDPPWQWAGTGFH